MEVQTTGGTHERTTEILAFRIVAAGTLIGLCLSYGLWTGDRFYSVVPILVQLDSFARGCGALPFFSLAALFILAVIIGPTRKLAAAIVLLGIFWSLLDQNRLQPWFFQALLVFFAFTAARQRLELCRLVLVGTYFWSGVQKINLSFPSEVFPWLVGSFFTAEPVSWVGYSIAFVELGLGLSLMSARTSRFAALGLIAMHAVILACIGPLGHSWNIVVWPWNIQMCLLCYVLFLAPGRKQFEVGRFIPATAAGVAVTCFALLLPGFNLVGLWDSYLSFALYSGNTIEASLSLDAASARRMPGWFSEISEPAADATQEVHLIDWSLAELGVPSYPAERVFLGVAASLCARFESPPALRLIIRYPPLLNSTRRTVRTLACSGLPQKSN